MKERGRVFFILACARSGSTSLATILNEASNGICRVEPAPNLNYETREMMEGRLSKPSDVVEKLVAPRIEEGLAEAQIYGEKNLTYGPFISQLYERFDCRFVLLVRDGGNVVRSLLDWHNNMFGSVYRECKEVGQLTSRAIMAAANLPVHLDMSDYSRPRPPKGSNLALEWENFTRAEMCTWYWQYIYDLYLNELEKIPEEAWTRIDYSSPNAEDILRVSDFLELQGLDYSKVNDMLDRRINSLVDRDAEGARHPAWVDWAPEMKARFRELAGKTSKRLGIPLP